METIKEENNDQKILSKIKKLYDESIEYLYISLTNLQSLLADTIDKNTNIYNIYDKNKIDDCQKSTNKILNKIKQRYAKDLKNNSNSNNKILYKSKLLNFYLKEIFKDENEKEEFFFPFYLLSYIMIVINHHEICLSEYFNGKIKINEFKSEDIDKNIISIALRCFLFIEMFSLYYQLKCKNNSYINKKNEESEIILNYFNTLNGNNNMSKKLINNLNEDEQNKLKNMANLSYKIIVIFLYDYEVNNKNNSINNNINPENILNQLINFSLLSYKDGLKTLIKESKLKKEIKIKIIKFKNYEYNNETLNLLFEQIKDQCPQNIININIKKENNNDSIKESNSKIDNDNNNTNKEKDNINKKNDNNNTIKENINNINFQDIINEQNNKIINLTNELNQFKTEFSDYKVKMNNIVKSLEKKIYELENTKKNDT